MQHRYARKQGRRRCYAGEDTGAPAAKNFEGGKEKGITNGSTLKVLIV